MKTIMRILMFLAPLTFAACSGNVKPQNERPDWVLGNSASYPVTTYLTGRGQADSMPLAQDRARADLAKNFSVNVSEQSRDVSSYSQTNAGPTPVMQNTLDVSRDISTRTDEMLRGVGIADTWQDPVTQQYYALAVLSRAKADASLRQQISDLDAGTRSYINAAQSSDDLFDKIVAAGHAVDAQQARAVLQQELQVVDITGRGMPPLWPLGELQSNRAALLKQLTISAAADGQNAEDVKKLLAGALADAGFTVAAKAPYTMTATLDTADLKPQGGWYWITGTLQVSLDGGKRAHGVRRWDIKVSGTDPKLAHQRLMDQVSDYLQKNIQQTVMDFAGGSSSP